MAVSQKASVVGSVTWGPPSVSATFPTLAATLSLRDEQTRGQGFSNARSIASPAAFVDLITGTGITTVHFIAIRINSGSLDIRMTTDAAVDAIIRCSNLHVWSSQNSGDGATALAVQGSANFEIIVAGD